jgi:protein SCO1
MRFDSRSAAALALLLPVLAAAQAPAGERAADLRIPDVALLDQDGRPVHFYRDLVAGRVVAIDFVFTSCTTICPVLGANFGQLRRLLGDRAGRDIRLISVSIDPARDTPARLRAWARRFGAGPGWTLVAGERDEVIRLLKALGLYTPDVTTHTPLVLVGDDARGEWTRTSGLVAPAALLEVIDQVAGRSGPKQGDKR